MSMNNLQDLFTEGLRDVYSAEKQIVAALPKMAKTATNSDLADAFNKHLEESKQHVARLEQIFKTLGLPMRGKKCKGMEGLLEEGKEIIDQNGESSVIDAGLIAAAQRVEHYEIAAYGCLRTYAELLGHNDIVSLLNQTLEEEEAADEKLTELGEAGINAAAAAAGVSEEDEE